MGLLVNGSWVEDSAGEGVAHTPIDAETALHPGDEYAFYTAHACPFAQSAALALSVSEKQLKAANITVKVVTTENTPNEQGWQFGDSNPDTVLGKAQLHEVYANYAPEYTGRVSVPLLVNISKNKLASNDSFGIMNLFGVHSNLFPQTDGQDELKKTVLSLTGKPYGAGFAKDQASYDKAKAEFFELLDKLDAALEGREFLVPGQTKPTGLDLRVIVSLYRFEGIYQFLFRLNRRTLQSYKNLWPYVQRVFSAYDGAVVETFKPDAIYENYFQGPAFLRLNPSGLAASAPDHVAALIPAAQA